MTEELKACPFCGGEVEYILHEDVDRINSITGEHECYDEHEIRCLSECPIVVMMSPEAWNTRVADNIEQQLSEQQEQIESLEAVNISNVKRIGALLTQNALLRGDLKTSEAEAIRKAVEAFKSTRTTRQLSNCSLGYFFNWLEQYASNLEGGE